MLPQVVTEDFTPPNDRFRQVPDRLFQMTGAVTLAFLRRLIHQVFDDLAGFIL
jgi:hypothetical protein